VRLPSFWAERPASWFTQTEAHFHLAGISNELTKFYHVVSYLDERYVAEVDDIINFTPQHDPYTTLKTELIKRLCPSRNQRTRQLFTLEEIGDQKPSQFLRHLRSLAPDIPDNYLQILWRSRLPTNAQVILAGMSEVGLDAAALCADRIIETVSPSTVASISPGPDYAELVQTVRNLSCQVARLVAERSRPNSRERSTSFLGPPPSLQQSSPQQLTR
jgi:antitoxin (DNA-binding transcriptional repressor) of toxin-antitoxin stability system